MKTKLIVAAVLAVFGAAAANAQIAYNPGDLVVGFRNAAGASNNLELDLGQFGQVLTSSFIDFGNVNGSLGTAGLSLNGINFSVAAQQGIGGQVVNGTTFLPYALFLTQSSAPATNPLGFTTAQGYSAPLANVGAGINGVTPLASSGLLVGQAAVISTSLASNNSYSQQNPAATIPLLEAVGSSSSNTSIELYQFNSTVPAGTGRGATPQGALAVTDLGQIQLSSAGELTFQAIPEPSTYAMILGVATLGFAAVRRRKQAQLLA